MRRRIETACSRPWHVTHEANPSTHEVAPRTGASWLARPSVHVNRCDRRARTLVRRRTVVRSNEWDRSRPVLAADLGSSRQLSRLHGAFASAYFASADGDGDTNRLEQLARQRHRPCGVHAGHLAHRAKGSPLHSIQPRTLLDLRLLKKGAGSRPSMSGVRAHSNVNQIHHALPGFSSMMTLLRYATAFSNPSLTLISESSCSMESTPS